MNWDIGYFGFTLVLLVLTAAACLVPQSLWRRRHNSLRQEMTRLSEDLIQLVELQAQVYKRIRDDINDLEGKVLDLAAPTSESPLPLQRRHQVLTLARKGIPVEEIARRLNMPKGEAELILSLRKYAKQAPPAEPAAGGMRGRAGA